MYDPTAFAHMSMFRAQISGSREAVYDYDSGVRYTFDDLERRANKLAWVLTHSFGLKKGDRVGFCASNHIAFIDAFYASCKTGIIITTYNCLLRESELSKLIASEDPKVIFYSAKYLPVVTKIRNSGGQRKFVALDGAFSEGRVFYEDLMKQEAGPVQPVDLQPDDTQLLIHTGGTTGTPKAAMLSYGGLFHNMVSEIVTLQLSHNDCAYVWLPLFHTAAWNVLTMPLLLAGGRIILTSEFSPGTSLKIIREERPTVGISVETIYKAMATHPDFLKTDFACYRWLINGAAPISRETLEVYWARGIKLVNGYGMTEIGASNLIPPINEVMGRRVRTALTGRFALKHCPPGLNSPDRIFLRKCCGLKPSGTSSGFTSKSASGGK